ncbi:MAG TPA: hypothetical protein VMV18_11260, partial [bacterium]|nr:hypothetical protein [bacterium]
MKKGRLDLWPHLLLIPASIVSIYPVLWVLKMALSPGQTFDSNPSPIPRALTLENFRAFTTT